MDTETFAISFEKHNRYKLIDLPMRLLLPLLIFLAGSGLAVYALWRMSIAYNRFGPATVSTVGYPWVYVSIILFALDAVFVTGILWEFRLGLDLDKNGIVLHNLIGSQKISWGAISGIGVTTKKSSGKENQKFLVDSIWLENGSQINLRRFASQEQRQRFFDLFSKILEEKIYRALHKKVEAGQPINFGIIGLQKTGLWLPRFFARQFYAWEVIKTVYLRNRSVIIGLESGQTMKYRLPDIANYPIFIKLVSEGKSVEPA